MLPIAGVVLLTATLCSAAHLHNKTSFTPNPNLKTPSGPGYIKIPLTVSNSSTVAKRQLNTGVFNPDEGTSYFIHLSIGTPPQAVVLSLDTGSSETWVNPDCATANTAGQTAECNANPIYNPTKSSTAEDAGAPFSLAYGKGSSSGEYFIDTFMVASGSIPGMSFGYADTSQYMDAGILAVGYGVEVAGYYCLIDMMAYDGLIASRAFSLDLGSVDVTSASGSLLFGGIDTKKYTGALTQRPIIGPDESIDGNYRYWVYMTEVGTTKAGKAYKRYTTAPPAYQQQVVLDCGSTLSHLPQNLVTAMLADFTGVVNQGSGYYSVDCAQTSQASTVDFGFGNLIIRVPYHQFIWEPSPGECYFGAQAHDPTTFDTWILGDTVMRSMYAVFDQDNGNIWLAQYVNCGTNILPIGSGANAVPSVTGACAPTTVGASTSATKPPSTTSKPTSSTKSSTKSSSSSAKSSSSSKTTSTAKTSSSTKKTSTSSTKTSSVTKTSSKTSTTAKTSSTCAAAKTVTVTVVSTQSATHGTCTAVGQKF